MDWASGHGSSFFWYIFFILFSEANLCSRYCSQHRMPDETSKLLHCHVFIKWLSWDQNWLPPKCKVNRLLLESKVRAHFMTSKPSCGEAAECPGVLLVKFSDCGEGRKRGAFLHRVLLDSKNWGGKTGEAVAKKPQLLGFFSGLTGFEAPKEPAKIYPQPVEERTGHSQWTPSPKSIWSTTHPT